MTSLLTLTYIVLIGAAAGWIGGLTLRGKGFGHLGNIIVGISGAILGGFLPPLLNPLAVQLICAIVGAIIFVFILRIIKR